MTTDYKDFLITQDEHRRLTAVIDSDGSVAIRETAIEGFRNPSQVVYLTKKELTKIARKCGLLPTQERRSK